ncbi:MAG: hypothetical protein K0Q95_1300 [Bacteroidota bacterium]|jgi:hypothetical protein|nr:hypothetical protein [Bacteroidota bacterium]
MEVLLTLAYSALFIFIIFKMKFFEVNGISKKSISMIFILKIISGVALWAIYTFYYKDRATADIYKYFDDSKIIADSLWVKPWDYLKMLTGIGNNTPEFDHYYSEMNYWARKIDSNIYNDSHTIIRFNAIARLFSLGYYNVHTVFICFLSLTGLTAIYKTFVPYLQDKKKELILAVFLLPSVLFWGSGVLKEGLIFFALGLLIYHSTKLFNIRSVLICLTSAFLLAFSKFYVWVAIVPGIIFLLWVYKTSSKYLLLKFISVFFIIGFVGLHIDSFTNIQNPLVTLSQKQYEFNQLASGELTDSNGNPIPVAGSTIEIKTLEPTLSSFLMNAPAALKNTLFRPYLTEMRSPMMLMAGAETLLIIFIILLCMIFAKPLINIKWEHVLFCLSFVIIQFLIIGETTPILGAVARYKTIALPFLVIAFLFILDKEKICERIAIYRKIFF